MKNSEAETDKFADNSESGKVELTKDSILPGKESKKQKLISGMFLTGVAGVAMLSGFLRTLKVEKKKDPSSFAQGMSGSKALHESGVALASRALMWGTIYSVGGFSAFCFIIWKLMGVHSMEEFRNKIQHKMPKVPKKEPEGRSDFKTVRELVNYIIEEDEKKKNNKR